MFKMAKKKIKAEEIKVNESAEIIEIIEPANVVEEAIMEEAIMEEEIMEEPIVEVVELDLPEQKAIPQLILDYINSQEGEYVELNDYFISLYSVPESLIASKDIKSTIDGLVKHKKIHLTNSHYHDLGKTYYDESGRAKKHSILDLKILAKK
jgi:hypothetical protein